MRTLGPGPWCGTLGGYQNHRCRCADCTNALRVYMLQYYIDHPEQVEKKRVRQRQLYARRRYNSGDIGGPGDACDTPRTGQLNQGAST